MRKILLSVITLIFIAGCTAHVKKAEPSAKEKVNGLKTMCADASVAMKQRQAEKSLFLRLGGREGIKEFTTKLLASHQKNKVIGHRFEHLPKERFVTNVTNFLAANSGEGSTYEGRNMEEVHRGMDISNAEFLVAGGEVKSVMKELGAGENEIQEAVCFLVSFVPQVVTE